MKPQQKAMIVWMEGERTRGLDELNIALGRGWRVVHAGPMGGAGGSRKEIRLASLVVLERADDALETARAEEESEAVSEGDGSSLDADTDLGDGPPAI